MSEENKQVLNEKTLKKVTVSPAQLRYATTLFYLGLASFIIMLVTYFLYVSGVTTPLVPLEEMPKLWVHRSAEYLARALIPQGWGWIKLLNKGDMANFIGIALLASVTLICYVQLAWSFIKSKEGIMVVIAILEIIVLVTAASGILV